LFIAFEYENVFIICAVKNKMALTGGRKFIGLDGQTDPIHPIQASSFILLAYHGRSLLEINKSLRVLIKDKGYNIRGHGFRSHIGYPVGRSEELDRFMGSLEGRGYAHVDFEAPGDFSLTEKGISLLELDVLRSFVEDSELTTRLAEDAGLELNPIIQKYLQRYFNLKDHLLLAMPALRECAKNQSYFGEDLKKIRENL